MASILSTTDSYDSMPPLIDRMGNIILDDRDTVAYSPMDVDEFEFNRPPPVIIPENNHLYFDEDGEEISREQFLMNMEREMRQQEEERRRHADDDEDEDEDDEEPFAFATPLIHQRFVLRHPRVLLDFLRFIDSYNEVAEADEVFMLPSIPPRIIESIMDRPSVQNVPQEFQPAVNELKWRLSRHVDLSELNIY